MSLPTRLIVAALALGLSVASSHAQRPKKADRPKLTTATIKSDDLLYKATPQGELKLHVFYPPGWKATDRRPVIVFFFGGGWRNGSYTQFVPQSEYFASRGIVTVSADYRIGVEGPFNIGLNAGTYVGATVSTRRMSNGANSIPYTLYRDSNRTLNWGNTISTDTQAGTGTGNNQSISVYGRVAGGAAVNVPAGVYTDTIQATITY